MGYSLLGTLFYLLIVFAFWHTRPKSSCHLWQLEDNSPQIGFLQKVMCCICTILLCILPMSLSPAWNGELNNHCDQYEKIAESFLHGHLYFDIDVDERLQAMDNPYDYEARTEEGVTSYWDHAYYKGHLYMYFGVVPALTLFVPYQFLVGCRLTTYHATQVYVAFFIIGVFLLFHLLRKLYFRSVSSLAYLSLCISLSVLSVLYSVSTPALYCTAQSAAFCFMIWSLFFIVKAVFDSQTGFQTFILAIIGTTLGALTFGCRPTIALSNVVLLPLALTYFKTRGGSISKMTLFCITLLPYLIIGVGLMWYNYVRFENPFEFGQSYQLTVADQTSYSDWFSRFNWDTIWRTLCFCLFFVPSGLNPVSIGVFFSYPLFWFALIGIARPKMFRQFGIHPLSFFTLISFISVFIIIIAIGLLSPFPLPRYRLDFNWLLSIVVFIVVGFIIENVTNKKKANYCVFVCSIVSILFCIWQFFYPYDMNFSEYYGNTVPQIVRQVFMPWCGIREIL